MIRGQHAPLWIPVVAVGTFVLAACAHNPPWIGPYYRDGAFFAYAGKLVTQGYLPYRDFFFIHGTLHPLLVGACDALSGKAGVIGLGLFVFGLQAWVTIHLAWGAVGRNLSLCRGAVLAVVSAGVAVGWPYLGHFVVCEFVVSGGRPKFLAIGLCGAGLLALSRNRMVLAGFVLAAAAWTWQPSALLSVGAVIAWVLTSRRVQETEKRPLSQGLVRLIPGTLALSLPMVAYLLLTGSLGGFLEQAVLFPFAFDEPEPISRWQRLGIKLWRMTPLFALVLGSLGCAWSIFRGFRPGDTEPSLDFRRGVCGSGLFAWALFYLVFLWRDFDGYGDVVPLLIPLGAWAGGFVADVGGNRELPWARILVLIGLGLWTGRAEFKDNLKSESSMSPDVAVAVGNAKQLRETAKESAILIFAMPQLQLALEEPPHHPYVFWEKQSLDVIEGREDGGPSGFARRLFQKRFGVVVVGRRAAGVTSILQPYLDRNFRPIEELQAIGLMVWERKPGRE